MTPRFPSSCSYALSTLNTSTSHHRQHAGLRMNIVAVNFERSTYRQYATRQKQQQQQHHAAERIAHNGAVTPARSSHNNNEEEAEYSSKAALLSIQSGIPRDPFNPPLSTLPPPLKLPVRSNENIALYLYRLGSAYGTFYKEGVKAVWFNWTAAKLLLRRINDDIEGGGGGNVGKAISTGRITRAEHEMLMRHERDVGKLPFFGILALVFGEWLPLLVPFVPSVVPGTCLIPSQVQSMRAAAEERRRRSFRKAVGEPTREQLLATTKERDEAWKIFTSLRSDQLLHLSTTLGLHNRLWDRIQLAPPDGLLRRALVRRAGYIRDDDFLLSRNGGPGGLSGEEVAIACEVRGIDILGKGEAVLREELARWLRAQEGDWFGGARVVQMLFRRPNAWEQLLKGR